VCQLFVKDQRERTRTYDLGGAGQALVAAVVAVAAEAGEESAETRAKRHFDGCRKKRKKKEGSERRQQESSYTRQLRAAAISRRGASLRSGAINEISVKLQL
jgi:hypothetical protein